MTIELDLDIYYLFNKDLQHLSSRKDLLAHYEKCGHKENRIQNIRTLVDRHELLIYFDLEYYKLHNPDVVLEGQDDKTIVLSYLYNYINDHGRPIRKDLDDFKSKKNLILNKILQDPLKRVYFTEEERKGYRIGINESESANEWGPEIDEFIQKYDVVVNIGAGYRKNPSTYFLYPNLINTEIFAYPTTDILCDGNRLPFKDHSVDLILSLAVLEHVPDPWNHAKEILRVLKPGGVLYVGVPFLQPYHGYPHHYYNMTSQGLVNLFQRVQPIEIIHHSIERYQTPVYTLMWFLKVYCEGLPDDVRKSFLQKTVAEIMENGNSNVLDYVKSLSPETEKIIAAGTTLVAKKVGN